jgi:hypothetical protein
LGVAGEWYETLSSGVEVEWLVVSLGDLVEWRCDVFIGSAGIMLVVDASEFCSELIERSFGVEISIFRRRLVVPIRFIFVVALLFCLFDNRFMVCSKFWLLFAERIVHCVVSFAVSFASLLISSVLFRCVVLSR